MDKERMCPGCKQTKPSKDFFNVRENVNYNKSGLSTYCRKCDSILHKQRYEKHKNDNMKWFLQYLGVDQLKCQHCEYDKSFVALQFHHRDPSKKEKTRDIFSVWLYQLGLKSFQKKIFSNKFIFLCANCHIELHNRIWRLDDAPGVSPTI